MAQVLEELVDLVDDGSDAAVRAVHRVDTEDDRLAGGEGLAEHEAGLRHRPLGGVDEQNDPSTMDRP